MLRLVLWDVDHTLIENAGVSKEIYAAAFRQLTGRPAARPAVTEGRTDPDIMADLLRSHGLGEAPWPSVQQALAAAGARHRQALAERGSILPGVLELVAALAETPSVVQTIVTGNIRANAEVKLAGFGLLQWLDLDVGGYGSDDRERAQLVAIAKRRAAEKYGDALGLPADAVVVGDTPRDIEAAKKGGARVLAVASGIHTSEVLREAGATRVLTDLADTQAALAFLLGGT